MKIFLVLFCLLLSVPAHAERLLFVINGQSNASGRGDLNQVPTYSNASRLYLFGNDHQWKQAYEPTDDPSGQLDTITQDSNAGAGFAMAFANKMADYYPNDEIAIVQCSIGSSKVQLFRRFWTDTSRHGVCINRVREAMQQSTLKGMVWWQFEGDTLVQSDALTWRENTANVWADLRHDLNSLELPIVFAIANNLNPQAYWATLRNTQSEMVSYKIKGVPTANIPFQSDKTHATTSGYVTWGELAADEMYLMLQ